MPYARQPLNSTMSKFWRREKGKLSLAEEVPFGVELAIICHVHHVICCSGPNSCIGIIEIVIVQVSRSQPEEVW